MLDARSAEGTRLAIARDAIGTYCKLLARYRDGITRGAEAAGKSPEAYIPKWLEKSDRISSEVLARIAQQVPTAGDPITAAGRDEDGISLIKSAIMLHRVAIRYAEEDVTADLELPEFVRPLKDACARIDKLVNELAQWEEFEGADRIAALQVAERRRAKREATAKAIQG